MSKLRALLVTALSLISVVLLMSTAAEPAWIEKLIGAEPDTSSGSAEVLITLALVSLTALSSLGTITAWRSEAGHGRERPHKPAADKG